MSVAPIAPIAPITNSSAPAAAASSVSSAPASDANSTTVVSVAGLERTSKIVPLLVVVLTLILTLAAWYGGLQANAAKYDTLITERGAKNAETREMVTELRHDYNASEKANAEFRGRTDASLQAIKDALLIERADRREFSGH